MMRMQMMRMRMMRLPMMRMQTMRMPMIKMRTTNLAKANSLSTGSAARAPLVDDEAVGEMCQLRGVPAFLGGKVKVGASELKTCQNLVQDTTRCWGGWFLTIRERLEYILKYLEDNQKGRGETFWRLTFFWTLNLGVFATKNLLRLKLQGICGFFIFWGLLDEERRRRCCCAMNIEDVRDSEKVAARS